MWLRPYYQQLQPSCHPRRHYYRLFLLDDHLHHHPQEALTIQLRYPIRLPIGSNDRGDGDILTASYSASPGIIHNPLARDYAVARHNVVGSVVPSTSTADDVVTARMRGLQQLLMNRTTPISDFEMSLLASSAGGLGSGATDFAALPQQSPQRQQQQNQRQDSTSIFTNSFIGAPPAASSDVRVHPSSLSYNLSDVSTSSTTYPPGISSAAPIRYNNILGSLAALLQQEQNMLLLQQQQQQQQQQYQHESSQQMQRQYQQQLQQPQQQLQPPHIQSQEYQHPTLRNMLEMGQLLQLSNHHNITTLLQDHELQQEQPQIISQVSFPEQLTLKPERSHRRKDQRKVDHDVETSDSLRDWKRSKLTESKDDMLESNSDHFEETAIPLLSASTNASQISNLAATASSAKTDFISETITSIKSRTPQQSMIEMKSQNYSDVWKDDASPLTIIQQENTKSTTTSANTSYLPKMSQDSVKHEPSSSSSYFGYDPGKLIRLHTDNDAHNISEYQCLLRQQILLFAAGTYDLQCSAQGRNKPISVGQVGLVCKHCCTIPPGLRSSGSVYYPAKLQGIYQAAQNMGTNHFMKRCSMIPDNIRQEMLEKKDKKTILFGGGKRYWVSSAMSLGLVEENDELRFQSTPPQEH